MVGDINRNIVGDIYRYLVGDIYRYIVGDIYRYIVGDIYRYIDGDIYRYILGYIYRYMVGYLQGIAESRYRDQRLFGLTSLFNFTLFSSFYIVVHLLGLYYFVLPLFFSAFSVFWFPLYLVFPSK